MAPQLPAIFRQAATKASDVLNSEGPQPHPYPPVVIGLGKTGETVLREWQEQVAQSSGFGEGGAGILIYVGRETVSFLQSGPNIRTFDLQQSGDTQTIYGVDSRSPRAYMRSLFGQAVYYEPFKNHLNKLVSKGRSIRVFVVGSLAEPIIGVLGSLLQVLSDYQEREPRPFHSINALLTFNSPPGITPLSQEEMYAALREIGRFTWKGPHVMPPPAFNERRRNYSSNLLDHLILIEATPDKAGIHKSGETAEMAEHMLSEGLFLLSHCASQEIWEHLSNELAVSSRLRNLLNDSAVHSFGVASLVLPLSLLERYAALRLVNAVLFGETDHLDGGLVEAVPASDKGASLASDWLKSPPYHHEFFAWLLTIQRSQQLSNFPEIEDKHAAVFRKKIAAHMTSFLNQPTGGKIVVAREALQWLATHFENIETMVKSLPPAKLNIPRTQSFLHVMAQLKATCIHLKQEVDEWLKVSYPEHVSSNHSGSFLTQYEDVFASLRDEFENSGKASFWQTENSPTSSHDSPTRIVWKDFIESTLEGVYQKLEQAARDASRRSVIERENIRQELADFYRNVIRPELHQPSGLIESPIFDPVRKRVGWWVVIPPEKEEPEIRAVCLPLSWNPERNFPLQFSFTYVHSNDFFEAIQDLCLHQVRTARQKMLDQFQSLALPRADFLSNAHRAFLEYDKNEVARIKGQTTNDHESERLAVRRGYILAPSPDLAQKYTSLFRDIPIGNVNSIGSMDSNRLSGLEITTFIPLSVVKRYQIARENYPFKDVVHLYQQEQNAKLFERKIRQTDTTYKRIQLSPGISLSLHSYPLTRLFFRALFAGLIFEASVQEGYQTFKVWQLTGLEDYPNINLARAPDLVSLENAFRTFTLETPYQYAHSGDPFHPDNRKAYLSALTRRVAQIERTEATIQERTQRADSFLEPLLQAGRHNTRLLEFALLLKVERETIFEPIFDDIDWEKELWH